MTPRITFEEKIPSVEAYQELRRAVGWYTVNDEDTHAGLHNSLFSICAIQNEKIIGCGRIIGDHGIYYYIQDVIVLPEYQKNGIGKRIMNELMNWLEQNAAENAFVGLMAASGVAGFYEQYGFAVRPADRPGMFIVWKKK